MIEEETHVYGTVIDDSNVNKFPIFPDPTVAHRLLAAVDISEKK